ncbi:EpsG family protein [Aeromonas piscicola]|uniref:EpsG family protein n=1 Tax=Aeromonas piscicola TaxID=600645 RepID=UPI001FCCC76A|nr:EpsG family protein [Aeromonas piscicola]
MTLYLVLLLYIPLLLLSICSEKDEKILKGAFLYIFLFFIFYHIDAGPDHHVYEWAYYEPPFSIPFEPVFGLLLATSKVFGLDYIEFLIALRLISFILFAYACLKLDKTKFIFLMGLYIPISFITFELNLLRQSLSLHFGLVAVCAYLKNRNKTSYVFMTLAVMSHLSAIVMALIYLNKIRVKVLVLLGMVGIMILMLALPAIISKINDYQALGALNIRMDVATLQLVVLMILPFLFFKTQGNIVPTLLYLTLCCMTFIPVLIRLYPIALLILLPSIAIAKGNKNMTTLFLFVSLSFFMTIGKTYLLLQADQNAIQEGMYQHGYTK